MELEDRTTEEGYNEDLEGLNDRYHSTRQTLEERTEIYNEMVKLASGQLSRILEGDRTQLPSFLQTTRKVLTQGEVNRTLNDSRYSHFLEDVMTKAIVPDVSSTSPTSS